ncbi:MAG TPA: MotA/TolQ/ExbB proton channel family protein [Acetivibrio sp.]|uniref:hypothetical protein n=1 Tax=Acetivibrio sp. TaxID=1872092 RepID=UPI002C986927|nr:hypothetical protein [Acetivibrio sp.]HOM01555.1 MotA/TolQ/ExbB proton channel family protein [Acetivibrio sp.]
MRFFSDLVIGLDPVGLAILFIIAVIFLFSLAINLFTRRKYFEIYNDLEKNCNTKNAKFKTSFLNEVVETYKKVSIGKYNDVNTRAIIENSFNRQLKPLLVCEKFVKYTVLILVTLGLLGTFWGLRFAVNEFSEGFNAITQPGALADSAFSGNFLSDLMPLMQGMGFAFTTSFFGTACAVLFALINIVINAGEARKTLMVSIEEYLDNTVSCEIEKDKETEYTMMNKILKETFDEFGEKIEKSLQQTTEAFGQKLTTVAMEVEITSKTLDNTVDKFDQALKNFAESMKDFTGFNENLKANIEKMDESFAKVAEALKDTSNIIKDTSKIVADNYNSVERFSKNIESTAEVVAGYNRKIVEDIGNIAEEVKASVSSIRKLGEAIKNDLVVRTDELKEYQEKFNNLTSRLDNEINLLGQKTAEAFSKSLDENSQAVTDKVVNYVDDVMKEVMEIIDELKENEKIFAKTIVMLPEQVTAYNETAAAQMSKQLDEVKRLFRKFE